MNIRDFTARFVVVAVLVSIFTQGGFTPAGAVFLLVVILVPWMTPRLFHWLFTCPAPKRQPEIVSVETTLRMLEKAGLAEGELESAKCAAKQK